MKYRHLTGILAALAVIFLTYANSFHNDFHFDDSHTVVENPYIRSLKNIPRFFTDASTFSVLPTNRTYRPVVSTTLAVDYWLGSGLNPVFFHLGTFCVYLLQIVVMLALFRKLFELTAPGRASFWLALFAATWYGVHPAMAETVNYIIQRGDIYCCFGVVLALALYIYYPGLRRTGIYLLPFVVALLSKPPAIVFPALLFVYLLLFETTEGKRLREAGRKTIPSLAVGLAMMLFSSAMTPRTFTPSTLSNSAYCLTQPFVLLRYFGAFFLPVHLNVDTDLRAFDSLNGRALCGFLFLAALLAAIVLLVRRKQMKPIAFGLLWFLLASLPTSVYKLAEVENDHRMFLPFVGLVMAVVWSLYLILRPIIQGRSAAQLRNAATVAAVLLLSCYAWGAHLRNQVWRTEESLWRDDVEKSPHNGRGLMNYGLTQLGQGRYVEAQRYFEEALRFTPNYPVLEINLGVTYDALGLASLAEQHFQRAVQLAPADDQTHYFYGRMLFLNGELQEALPQLLIAYRENPARPATRSLLMQAYAQNDDTEALRQVAKAILSAFPDDPAATGYLRNSVHPDADYWITASLRQYQRKNYAASLAAAKRAKELQPNSAFASINIGAAYAALGQFELAIEAEREALHLQPDLVLARNNLNAYLALQSQANTSSQERTPEGLLTESLQLNQAGRYQQSIAAARSALKLRPTYAEAWNNVAAGYAALGKWDEAIAAAKEAVRLKPDFQLAKNNLLWAEGEKQKTSGRR